MKRILKSSLNRLLVRCGRRYLSHFQGLIEPVYLQRLFEYFDIDCVFDVGANAGQYGQMLRKKVGYRGRIISFEPIPELAERVEAISAKDPLWEIIRLALSSEDGSAQFNVMKDSQFSSLQEPKHVLDGLFDDANSVDRRSTVRVARLDSLYQELQSKYKFSRPFLKMDTQGHDLSVVAGAGNCLANFIGMQSELAVVGLYQDAPLFDEVIRGYSDLGFFLSGFVPNNAGHFPILVETDGIFIRSDLRS